MDSETSCQMQCLKHIRCFSYSLGSINEKGKFTCQLRDFDRFTSRENFTQDKKSHYRGMEVINRTKKLKEILLSCFSSSLQLFLSQNQTKHRVMEDFNDGYTDSLSILSDLIYYRDINIGHHRVRS